MVNVKLGDKTYTGVTAVKTDTTDGGTAEFAPYDETFAAGKAEGIEEGYANGKTDGVAEGIQTEYDRFWDAYQDYGAICFFHRYFGTERWNDVTFYPKYNIILEGYGVYEAFRSNQCTNIPQRLEECGVVLDVSRGEYFSGAFRDTFTARWPVLDLSMAKVTDYAFYNTMAHTIDKIIANENCTWVYTFRSASNLANVIFEGVIGQDIDFQWSPLSADSITSVITHLSDSSVGKIATFKLNAVNTAFETAEGAADGSSSQAWLDLVATKPNWTISLV